MVSLLRKGEAFGDAAIIAGHSHSTAASPTSNASLLVVSREVRQRPAAAMHARALRISRACDSHGAGCLVYLHCVWQHVHHEVRG